MAILLTPDTRVLVQGITGSLGTLATELMLSSGTRVVAGVTPKKGGTFVHDVPVYETVAQACAEQHANASFISVPPLAAQPAVFEAVDAGIKLIVCITENIPLLDAAAMIAYCKQKDVTLIGPGSVGICSSGVGRIGPIGGYASMVEQIYAPGSIGIISKSGGMTNETAWVVRQAGFGQSSVIGIGGEQLIGTSYADLLRRFEADTQTNAVVVFGELGGNAEDEIVTMLEQKQFTKPLIVFIGGIFAERMPSDIQFGHAGAIIRSGRGGPTEKRARLARAGALITEQHHQIGEIIKAHVPLP